MNNIILVAETGSDIPKDIAEEMGIFLVPMHVTMGSDTFDDGTFPIEKIYEYYEDTNKIPKTSGSSPEDFIRVFDEIHRLYPDKQILHLAYSAVTTCSYQSALISAEDRDYIMSFDTKQVSIGQAAIVIQTAIYLKANPNVTMEELVEEVRNLRDSCQMCFVPDKLEYLKAGGRVSNAVFIGGKILSIHPSIEIENGYLVAKKKYRGKMERVVTKMIEEYSHMKNLDKKEVWLLWSMGLPNTVRRAAEHKIKEIGFEKIRWMQTGCVITTHGGPGSFGIVGFSKAI
ncbi:DegV family EDD domain-containing protein [Clostridium gasigenes]|uniref:DegV family protein n=1 Tax=Clostridium gasigenes TaxID=94869 RepID=UPI0014382F08|nr:DegV family protein [Clostridium gasigenes]NKF08761.1 DegV family EDD domain-containing protein [Clostridium gasigenes]QSW19624.1 DegV family EDD domain-containing protein [Clostridium gasigenes]